MNNVYTVVKKYTHIVITKLLAKIFLYCIHIQSIFDIDVVG